MTQELIYTSAPKGLRLGSRGFCTVASSAGMAKPLADRLEALSGYRHLHPPGSDTAHLNPINYSYLSFKLSGASYYVLSRVADAGLDHTQRSNKLAHHVVLSSTDLAGAGPAWIISQPGFFMTSWDAEPHIIQQSHSIPAGELKPQACRTWQALTGDAGWGGVLAESAITGKEAYVIYPVGKNVLPLIVECQSLLTTSQRWAATFSTYYMKLPPGVECRWRFIPDGTPEAQLARRSPGQLVIDLCAKLKAAPEGTLVQLARSGKPIAPPMAPPVPSAATGPAPTDSEEVSVTLPEIQPEYVLDHGTALPPSLPLRARRSWDRDVPEKSGRRWLAWVVGLAAVLVASLIGIAAYVFTQNPDSSLANNANQAETPAESDGIPRREPKSPGNSDQPPAANAPTPPITALPEPVPHVAVPLSAPEASTPSISPVQVPDLFSSSHLTIDIKSIASTPTKREDSLRSVRSDFTIDAFGLAGSDRPISGLPQKGINFISTTMTWVGPKRNPLARLELQGELPSTLNFEVLAAENDESLKELASSCVLIKDSANGRSLVVSFTKEAVVGAKRLDLSKVNQRFAELDIAVPPYQGARAQIQVVSLSGEYAPSITEIVLAPANAENDTKSEKSVLSQSSNLIRFGRNDAFTLKSDLRRLSKTGIARLVVMVSADGKPIRDFINGLLEIRRQELLSAINFYFEEIKIPERPKDPGHLETWKDEWKELSDLRKKYYHNWSLPISIQLEIDEARVRELNPNRVEQARSLSHHVNAHGSVEDLFHLEKELSEMTLKGTIYRNLYNSRASQPISIPAVAFID